ncbi:MAG: hypothetical protein KGQ38_06775, partial [Actinomycetales bacterium]|nr:hypothetical protein [Actinomycetales bacterium]
MSLDFHAQQASNQRKTLLLLFSMAVLTFILVYSVGLWLGQGSAALFPLAVIFALAMVWGSYYNSDKLVMSMTGAKIIDHDSAPQL